MMASGSPSRIMRSHSPCRSLSNGPRGVLTGARTRTDNIPDFIDESYARMQMNCARIATVLNMKDTHSAPETKQMTAQETLD
jgi:hypothetical protein